MKVLSWLCAFGLFVAVAAGTASVLRLHADGAQALPASGLAVALVPHQAAEATPTPVSIPSPSPAAKPKPRPIAAPAPAKAGAPVARPAAAPAIVVRSTQQALINQDRARYGLRPLSWSSCLATIAYSNALRMAQQGYISHTNGPTRDLGCRLGGHAGENVGYWSVMLANRDAKLNTMFMNSTDHRANILSPYYHYVATSWVTASNGAIYVAVEFS